MPQEVLVFFYACFLGFAIGVFYDIFRVLRIIFNSGKIICFIEDLLFFIIITAVSFAFIMVINNGILRGFILIGELTGAILYFCTLSIPIIKFLRLVINAIRKAISFVYCKTLKKLFVLIKIKINKLISQINVRFKMCIAEKNTKSTKKIKKGHKKGKKI